MSTSEDVVQAVTAALETLFPGQYAVSIHPDERSQDDVHFLVVSRADSERGAVFALDTEVLEERGPAEAARRLSDQMARVIEQELPTRQGDVYLGYDAT